MQRSHLCFFTGSFRQLSQVVLFYSINPILYAILILTIGIGGRDDLSVDGLFRFEFDLVKAVAFTQHRLCLCHVMVS